MRTIDVTDEMYEFLMNLSKELNTQDHRCTAMPYFYQIREQKETPAPEFCGDKVWVADGAVHLRTEEDVKEAIFEWKDWDLEDEAANKKYEELDDFDKEDILEENYRKAWVTKEYSYQNAFLTEKACTEHIEKNHHHYQNPVDFLTHSFRNPELEKVMQFLCELSGGKLHK